MVATLATPLRGVARRRAEALRVEEQPHDTVLKPLTASMIVTANEQDFVAAVLADLKASNWRDRLRARGAQRDNNVLMLSQPVHRTFNLVLLEAACAVPGGPRLDPKKIKGSGLVLRRESASGLQGWMSAGPAKRGWLALGARAADPDPASRDAVRSGRVDLDRLLTERRAAEALAEQVFPLFVAPPDVCAALGKTVLYGVVPVASSELSEAPVAAPDYVAQFNADGGDLSDHLSIYFKTRPGFDPPLAARVLSRDWAQGDSSEAEAVRPLVTFIRQLAIECDAFGQSPQSRALMNVLADVRLGTRLDAFGGVAETIPADDFLLSAAAVFLDGGNNEQGIKMPLRWPSIDEALSGRLIAAAIAAMAARFAAVAPKEAKFGEQARYYHLRAFVRVACRRNCPPKLCWSDASEHFKILPWWAGSGPPAKVPLPDVADPAVRNGLKPGVAFEVPQSLARFLNQDLSKVLSGAPPGAGTDLGFGMLCSFSIPIITICAFVVLSIILALLNIVFWWLPFVKICFPIPKRGGN